MLGEIVLRLENPPFDKEIAADPLIVLLGRC
jgi:hypothetical protein